MLKKIWNPMAWKMRIHSIELSGESVLADCCIPQLLGRLQQYNLIWILFFYKL